MAQFFRIFLSCVFIIFVVYGVLSLRIYRVSGDSMLPNLADGQYVLTDKLSQIIFPFSRGEIVVYHDGDGNDTLRVKRLI